MPGKRKRDDNEPKPASWWESPQWVIHYPDVSSNAKLSKGEQELKNVAAIQHSPFQAKGQAEGALDTAYVVTPQIEWKALKKYSNFIISNETYSSKEYVWVRPAEEEITRAVKPVGEVEGTPFWVAKVLEVRAKDASHVYALISWMYSPDELPKLRDQGLVTSGRRPYHGTHEVIASNAFDILDVSTFGGKAQVTHWLEEDEEAEMVGLYWRQTYDHRNGGKLSELRKHCICQEYFNPDKSMVGCANKSCHIWLHADCLIDDALNKTYDRLIGFDNDSISTSGSTKKPKKRKSAVLDKKYAASFTAELKDITDHPQIAITDLRSGKTWREDINCLKCGEKFE